MLRFYGGPNHTAAVFEVYDNYTVVGLPEVALRETLVLYAGHVFDIFPLVSSEEEILTLF